MVCVPSMAATKTNLAIEAGKASRFTSKLALLPERARRTASPGLASWL